MSWPDVAWSSEQRTPSLCDCYSFGRSRFARCLFLPGLSAPVVTDAFAIACAVTRPGLDPHPILGEFFFIGAVRLHSTAHGLPFVFSYRVVGVLPSSSWHLGLLVLRAGGWAPNFFSFLRRNGAQAVHSSWSARRTELWARWHAVACYWV